MALQRANEEPWQIRMGAVFSFLLRFLHSEVQSCIRVKSAQGPEFESLWPAETLSGMEQFCG